VRLNGKRILIAGSADDDVPRGRLEYAHALVSKLVSEIARRGGSFVVSFGREPMLNDESSPLSIIFEWTIARTLEVALERGEAEASGASGRLVRTIATAKTDMHIPPDRRDTYEMLRRRDAVDMEFLEQGWNSGAARRERQAQFSDVLITISGGEGVEHLAQEFTRRGKPVIPLDIELGSSCRDGSGGSMRLRGEALRNPSTFFKVSSSESPGELLDRTKSRQGERAVDEVAEAILSLLARLLPPRVFYVRLLNPDSLNYEVVETFFRQVVDPVVTELGLEPLQMGVGNNEYAWMNQAIFDSLHHSEVVVVDLTGVRPNCLMELGYALGNTQRVIITAIRGTSLPFDSSCLDTYMWHLDGEIEDAVTGFKNHWARNINMPPLVRPRGLR
jgi:hypothetical protein